MSVVRALVLVLVAAAPMAAAAAACAAEGFSNNRVYAACSDLPTLGASLHWTHDPAAPSLSVAFVAAPSSAGGWVAWGLNPTGDGMVGLQALIAAPSKGGAGYAVQTYDVTGYSLGSPGPIAYPTSDLAAELGADGRVQMFGRLALRNGTTGEVINHVWQVGPVSGGSIGVHALATANNDAKGRLNLVTGASTAATGGGSHRRQKNNLCHTKKMVLALVMTAITDIEKNLCHTEKVVGMNQAMETAAIRDDVTSTARMFETGPLLQPREHASWLMRLEERLRVFYQTLTCTRALDVVPQRAPRRPPRPSMQPQVTPPTRASFHGGPRPRFAPQATTRAPPPNQPGGSTWYQQQFDDGGSTWDQQSSPSKR